MLINKLLTSSTFFALCVVYTVISAIDIVSSSGVDLVSVLVVVFMWILRDSAFKQKPPTDIVKSFKVLNVVTTVCYVLVWVAVGLVTLVAFITLVSADFLSSVSLFDDVAYGVEAEIIELFLSGASWLVIFMIIIAVLLALYNVYFIGNCRKCAESFVRSCETGYSMFEKMDTVKKWFKTLGIINIAIAAISVIGMFSLIPLVGFAVAIASLLSYGLNGALYLLFAKCFDEFEMSFYS